jgi:hypothetical protein
MDVAKWLEEMQSLFDALCSMRESTMTDHEFTIAILNNAPKTEAWRVAITGLRNKLHLYESQGKPIRPSEFISNVRDKNWYYNRENPQSSAYVFTARGDSVKKSLKRPRAFDATATSLKRPRATPTLTSSAKRCTNSHCTRKGHRFKDCVTFGGGSPGNYPVYWKGPWNLHLPAERRSGDNNIPPANHPAYARLAEAAQAAVCFFDPSSHDNDESAIDEDLTDADEGSTLGEELSDSFAFSVLLDEPSNSSNEPAIATLSVLEVSLPRTDHCHYDSGANRHVFYNRAAFDTYKSTTPTPVKGFGHKHSAMVIGRGSVHLSACSRTHKSMITLYHVLYIPAARSNLVSGIILGKAGADIAFTGPSLILSAKGKPVCNGKIQNDMYRLDLDIIYPSAQPALLSRIEPLQPRALLTTADHKDFPTA